MALSGSNNGGGGTGGSYLRLEWNASQNQGANQSTINAYLYLVLQGGTSLVATESGDINIDGAQYTYSRGSTSRGTNSTSLVHSASRTIGHNNDGTRSFQIGGYFDSGWSGFPNISVGMNTWTLNTIPRYASISSWSVGSSTDTAATISLNTDVTADLVDYQINGGSWVRGYTGDFTSRSFTVSGLVPGTSYSFKVRVRRKDSGQYTESGSKSATTQTFSITSLTNPARTQNTSDIRVQVNYTSDLIQTRVNGSSTWTDWVGDYTDKTVTITGLSPNTTTTHDVRSRHKASGIYSSVSTVSVTTFYPTPLKATNLSPGSGTAVSTLVPTLSWTYNATGTDFQSAYQVIVTNQSTSAVAWDSGKVASTVSSVQIPVSELSWNVNYIWTVKTWGGIDTEGPTSDAVVFKTSQAPTVNITSPSDSSTIPTTTPTISWTYSDPESTVQSQYTIFVESIENPGENVGEIVFQETLTGTDTSYSIPSGILQNSGRYLLTVSSRDSDGISGTSSPVEIYIQFIAPAAPSLEVEISEDKMYVGAYTLTGTPQDDGFESEFINLYKREVGTQTWNYVDRATASFMIIDGMDSAAGWTAETAGSTVTTNSNSKSGSGSLSLTKSSSGTSQFSATPSITSISGADKIRVWVRLEDASDVTSITFRFGNNSSNYYSFQVNGNTFSDGEWKSIEVLTNSLSITGSPSLGNISYEKIVMVSSTAIGEGEVLVDNLRAINEESFLFIPDYDIANGKTYEYAAAAFSGVANAESEYTIASETVEIKYDHRKNTFLIPLNDKSTGLTGFMSGDFQPTWSTNTVTTYLQPVGSKYPVAYYSSIQKYKNGQIEIGFLCKGNGQYLGIDGVDAIEAIMNEKPILLRTWWGKNYTISIDGQIQPRYENNIGWFVSFNFTEIADVRQ